jgi:pimeloyl-ACP methyl ester carboxylesterase
MSRLRGLLPLLLLVAALQGCQVPLQPYRLGQPAIIVPPPALQGQAAPSPPDQNCVNPATPVCLAFIEVDDMGELFMKGELDTALAVIRRATDVANDSGQPAPVVITFVHGWKNNAAPRNDNVEGFKKSLWDVYSAVGGSRHVIGVYIGWRGNLINQSFPVAQQLSYFNREAAAIRIPGATLSSALTQIAARTHENKDGLAIFIGHSFGGLLLERAVSEATAAQIAQATIYEQQAEKLLASHQDASEECKLANAAANERADLVIFINPAGAATEARQMLDFLAYNQYRYQPFVSQVCGAPAPAADNSADRPLIVSLTSTADLATKLALPIGHAVPDLQFNMAGSFRDLSDKPNGHYQLPCFDPRLAHPSREITRKEDGAVPQSSYYMSTAPHMPILQSHVMLKAIGATQMQVASTGEKITIHNPDAIANCNRDLLNAENLNIVSTFRLYDTHACFAIQERPNRCNGTPYWMMEIDPDVVPDHSTIFTERFIHFLIDTFFAPNGQQMDRVGSQLVH